MTKPPFLPPMYAPDSLDNRAQREGRPEPRAAMEPHRDDSLNYERSVDGLRKSNASLLKACKLAAVRLEGGTVKEQGFNKGVANALRSAIAQAEGAWATTPTKTITVHVEGGLVQDVTGIPAGYEVRVEDRDDDGDTSHPSWDEEKQCFVTVYEGGAS